MSSTYVNLPNTLEKLNSIYEANGNRKKRFSKSDFSEMLDLGKAATDNYLLGARSFGMLETLSSREFKLSDEMCQFLRLQRNYQRMVHKMVLSNPAFKSIIMYFGNIIPSHRKLTKFLMQEQKLGKSATASTAHNYLQTAHWLDQQGLYNFDLVALEDEHLNPDQDETPDNSEDTSKNNGNDDSNANPSGSKGEGEESNNKGGKNSGGNSSGGQSEDDGSKRSPKHHSLPTWARRELEYCEDRIAYLKDLIPQLKEKLENAENELYKLQRRAYELKQGRY